MFHCLSVKDIRSALRAATAIASRLGLGGDGIGRFLLFADEALSNALNHSAADRILLTLVRKNGEDGGTVLDVTVQDCGPPFNPLRAKVGVGKNGYGISLLKKLFPNIRYRRRGGNNLLRVEIGI